MYYIGVQSNNYPEERNIINKVNNASYIYKTSFESPPKYLTYIFIRIIKKIELLFNRRHFFIKPNPINNSFFLDFQKDIHFFHFFNSTLFGKNNWGVTFETLVPYHDHNTINVFLRDEKVIFDHKNDVKRISKKNCKFIIAISECSYNIQKEYLNHFPFYKKRILKKTHILHPPQKLLLEKYIKPDVSNGITFMFIGSEFLCKGAIEILRTFSKIKDQYLNFNLILIGDFDRTNGRCEITENEIFAFKKLINSSPSRISYLKRMPNDKVLKKMKEEVHIGLLPTHADTYGYSVLEFQAAGCPVISTNIRSLPEINNEECGWMIEIPKSSLGEPFSRRKSELIHMQNIIENRLTEIMIDIIKNPKIIRSKGEKSLERIKKYHCVKEYEKKLQKIYEKAK